MEVAFSALIVVIAAGFVIYNRPVATYFVENNTTPFTFTHPKHRLPREERPEQWEDFRKARDFWLPFMRIFVVVVAVVIGFGAAANLVALII